jgi:hypothetical protein
MLLTHMPCTLPLHQHPPSNYRQSQFTNVFNELDVHGLFGKDIRSLLRVSAITPVYVNMLGAFVELWVPSHRD